MQYRPFPQSFEHHWQDDLSSYIQITSQQRFNYWYRELTLYKWN
ncbi:hypothetical protein [Chitinophaga silvatica]|nr:hypothetical protein [Chitinophaga silvatica]